MHSFHNPHLLAEKWRLQGPRGRRRHKKEEAQATESLVEDTQPEHIP